MRLPPVSGSKARARLALWLAALLAAALGGALLVRGRLANQQPSAQPAPDFTLTDQFGRPFALRQDRGKVVFLAFVDSQCTTICPLTTQSMVQALKLLGPAAGQVALVGVNANPQATSVADVRAYSRAHGLLQSWEFGTGSPAQLQAVWAAYHVATEIIAGAIDHTPALYVLDQRGDERYLYLTPLQYATLPQEAQILAGDAARLLPSHPKVLPAPKPGGPAIAASTQAATLPLLAAPGKPASLGPGQARLVVFWASWAPDAAAQLRALDAYADTATREHLPPLTAVDVGEVEATPQAPTVLLRQAGALGYPVALDASGAVAGAYGVQDLPWLTLTDAAGRVRWSHDGWLSSSALAAAVQQALRSAPGAASG